jgi:hypothetical protein
MRWKDIALPEVTQHAPVIGEHRLFTAHLRRQMSRCVAIEGKRETEKMSSLFPDSFR